MHRNGSQREPTVSHREPYSVPRGNQNRKKSLKRGDIYIYIYMGFPGGSVVRNNLARQEAWVPPQDRGDPLEKGVAIHSGMLA